MIECSKCLTWLHFSCAKVKKNHIPDVFICIKCTTKKLDTSTADEEDDSRLNDLQLSDKSSTKQHPNEIDEKKPLENQSEKAAIITSDNTVSSTVDSDTNNIHSTTPNKTNNHLDNKYRSNRKTIIDQVA